MNGVRCRIETMHRVIRRGGLALALVAFLASGALAPLAAQRPVADGNASRTSDTKAAEAVLAKLIDVRIDQRSLGDVITMLAEQAGATLVYRPDVVARYTAPVSVHATRTSLGAVLRRALVGTALKVVPLDDGRIAIAVDPEGRANVAGGIVSGRVTDARTQRPVANASVMLDDSARVAHTDVDGHFRFINVAAGTHRVVVRSVGFARQNRSVTVSDEQTTTMEIVLTSSVNTLDQVVVTATGAQRYRELGHVVSVVNADSVIRESRVTSLSELLTARVPGLQVLPGNGGVVGGEVALRLRGQTTSALDPQPVVIVDGVRYRDNNLTDNGQGLVAQRGRDFGNEGRSPLNDLNVNDIETIEVVKGPSASTLYGPDAANGVIVITTKRGKTGKTQWHFYTSPSLTMQPSTDATPSTGYRGWGHDPNTGETVAFNCTLEYQAQPAPQCVLDSITTAPSVLFDPRYSILAKQRPQWYSGASVSGGVSALTYFFSTNYTNETGSLKVSPYMAELIESQLGTDKLDDAIRDPNTQQTTGFSATIAAQLNPTTEVHVVGNYVQATQRAVNINSLYQSELLVGTIPPNTDSTYLQQIPTYAMLQSSQMQMNRLIASGGATMHPWPWLTLTADLGADIGSSIDRVIEPTGAEGADFTGYVSEDRAQNMNRNASLGATAEARGGSVTFRSSVGTQYTYTKLDATLTQGLGIAPGSSSISTATQVAASQSWNETAELGVYGEEVVGWRDRLFVTGSLRLDGSTTFGDAYKARPFPKAGVSWIVSEEPFFQPLRDRGVNELRLRFSYGVASRYPTSEMKEGIVNALTTQFSGQSWNTFSRTLLANPTVGPERSGDAEYGLDATLATNVSLGLAWYHRRTNDQLNRLTMPTGFTTQWANVGDVVSKGFEATLGVKVLQSRPLAVDLNATYARNTDKLVRLKDATGTQLLSGSLWVGAPLGASFGQTITAVSDNNGDGIINSDEYTLTPVHYLGTLFAPNVYTLSPEIAVLGSHLRFRTLVDRQTGGVQVDRVTPGCGNAGLCVAAFLKTTPLREQAKILGFVQGEQVVSSNFTRWRELSLTADVPTSLLRPLRLSQATTSLQVRNLALWTNFRSPDPESIPGLGQVALYRGQNVGIPQARAWTIRVDVTP